MHLKAASWEASVAVLFVVSLPLFSAVALPLPENARSRYSIGGDEEIGKSKWQAVERHVGSKIAVFLFALSSCFIQVTTLTCSSNRCVTLA